MGLSKISPNRDGSGNLATGTGAGCFRRTLRSNINCFLPRGTALVASRRRTKETGCTSFFNIEAPTGTYFQHQYEDGTSGTLTGVGQDMAKTYFFPVHPKATLMAGLPAFDQIPTINYDAIWAGKEKKRLVDRWINEVLRTAK